MSRIRSDSQINPLGRLGTPEEVASAYIFLMVNTYTTGQLLQIDGGIAPMLLTGVEGEAYGGRVGSVFSHCPTRRFGAVSPQSSTTERR